MKIAIAGASGRAGSRITAELARRGHRSPPLPAIPTRSNASPNVTAVKGDVLDQAGLARLWSGHDAAVSSVHFTASDPDKLIGAARIRRSADTSWSAAPAASKSPPASGW